MKIISNIYILGIVFFVSTCSFGQETSTSSKEDLITVLNTLKQQFNVEFNYSQSELDEVKVSKPDFSKSLPKILLQLEKETKFTFEKIDARFVVVKLKKGILICGFLKNKDDNSPIEAATIQGTTNATTSDANGFFRLKISSAKELIIIRHISYKTVRRLSDYFTDDGCGIVFLRTQTESLSSVIISNYLATGINKLGNGAFTIDFKNFDLLPGMIENDVLQAVQAFPGIQSTNETVSNLSIRGGTHDQNLIKWDGIKMYQSGHFFGLISMYNPQITQTVHLLKNGTDISETDGVSGTITMETAKNITTSFRGNAGVNFTDANVFLDTPLGNKSSIQVAARKSINDLVKTPAYTAYFKQIAQDTEVAENQGNIVNSDKDFDFYDASFRWLYAIDERNELRLNGIFVSNTLDFTETLLTDSVEDSKESSLQQNSFAAGLYYRNNWRDQLFTTVEIYETDYQLKAINANVLDSQRFLQENKVSETSAKIKANYIFNEKFNLNAGYHFVETEVTNLDDIDVPLIRTLISEVLRTHAFFTGIDFSSADKATQISLGGRYNYLDKFKKHIIEPRFSLSHTFLENFIVEAQGEFKHQSTSQIINFQNDFLGIEKRRWQLSNDADIPVLTSKQASVGISYQKDNWLASADVYYKEVDGITTQSQGFQNQYEFTKASGRYSVNGIDVLLRKRVTNLNIWMSYSYMQNNYEFTTLEANPFPSNYDITHALTSGITYTRKSLKLGLGFNWRTGKPITMPVVGNEILNDEINYQDVNSSQLDDYFRVDFSAKYAYQLNENLRLDVAFALWNVLNTNNQIERYYRINNQDTVSDIQRFSLGMTPNFSCRLYF
ncbi:TonB-dependent receptor-like protein [Kordia periserrulae]|uniref:TonB-dependent receptor-like protein n=1 Tax=Kordia periserrulae TaxID=701523 RepID=A0A2T6BTP6_9FLAO|nr:TonB-dependent receptor plug domain-containing protein [Kordia periserrulae]PTX59452.1 TonB-dependent receptor-like protein [Kordia periserrulae]